MPTIKIDGEAYEVEEGRMVLQAIDDLGLLMSGVDIPHYCWHPKLAIDGSCRLCQVEVEGVPKLQIACNTPVQDGMSIITKSERVQQARSGVMELLLINHPLDCPICDQAGECSLQDYAFDYGRSGARTREPRRPAKKATELGPTIVFDQERCILCRRCVRFCREVPGTGELGVFSRGDPKTIGKNSSKWLGRSDNSGSVVSSFVCVQAETIAVIPMRNIKGRMTAWKRLACMAIASLRTTVWLVRAVIGTERNRRH